MHALMLKEVIRVCRERIMQGDRPTTAAISVEQLEDAVSELDKANAVLREKADPMSHAWKSDYAQAKEESAAEVMFCPHCHPCRHRDELTQLRAERDAAQAVIRWALGEEGEFPDWPDTVTITGNPKYWWRKELRERYEAALRASDRHPSREPMTRTGMGCS